MRLSPAPRPSSARNAERLYKGHLSEFTPLSSLHAPARKSGDAHGLNPHPPRRSEGLSKKLMYTQWGGGADYCTFSSFLRFGENSRRSGYAYNGAGPETSV
ncbi:hypothetical protein AGOR_G00219450 [Albula goreensis]|uniref:Uncharacterized protein n=1 Tax=Albula goreensis TaxID=1534307 RepID=A0A8T3CN30_9TELE|nr:hypothetical protein AGOR_G00219450 [Albula goreensis]